MHCSCIVEQSQEEQRSVRRVKAVIEIAVVVGLSWSEVLRLAACQPASKQFASSFA